MTVGLPKVKVVRSFWS